MGAWDSEDTTGRATNAGGLELCAGRDAEWVRENEAEDGGGALRVWLELR